LAAFRGSDAVAAGLLTWSRLRCGGWRRLFTDVYVSADLRLDHRLWCEAAIVHTRRAPGVAVSGLSAALLMGADLLPVGGCPVTLTVPPSIRVSSPHLVVVRSRLAAADIVTVSRLPVTSPARTAFDVARSLPRIDAVSAVDALLHRRIVTMTQARAYAAALRRGSRRAGTIFDLADEGAGSPMETRLRLCLVDAGLPCPETQVRVLSADGSLIGRVDLAYRKQRIGIEYEGDHHRAPTAFRHDIARVNAMHEAGWIIVRVTADDIRYPANLLRQLRALLSTRPSIMAA